MTNTDLVLNGSLTIPTGTSIDNANNRALSLAGNWNNSGTFTPGTGSVTFNGAAAQSATGTNSFYNLTINNTNDVTFSGAGSNAVSNSLTFTNGRIVSSATNLLNLGASATVSGASSTSYVSGPMSKVVGAGVSFTAPVGKITPGRYRPVTVESTSGSDTWNFEYFGVNATTGGFTTTTMNTANILTVSIYEYWQVTRAGATTAGLTLSYDVGSYFPPNIGSLTDLRVARWDTSVPRWDLAPGGGTHSATGTNITGTVNVTTSTNFGAVTLASIVSPSPLPIQLLSFEGRIVPMGVQLLWKTASELNNDHFEVEKSTDGEKFQSIANIRGNGTSPVSHSYEYLDTKVATGRTYYRLKQVDFDGHSSYSNIIDVNSDGIFTFSVYPNPVTGTDLNFQILGIEGTNMMGVSLFDELGRKILSAQAPIDEFSGSITGSLPIDKLANGIYYFRVDGTAIYSKVVIRR
jgi:hypothetical protein